MNAPYPNQPDTNAGLDIIAITGRIGAEIRGLRLSRKIDATTIAAIRRALARHKVIFFRDQPHLDDVEQEAFAGLLGEKLLVHNELMARHGTRAIMELNADDGGTANLWHTDVTFVENIPTASVLRAVEIPQAGGDTLWANCATAYAALPADLKALADRAWVLHSNEFGYAAKMAELDEAADATSEGRPPSLAVSTIYETEHPLVRVHPETGERSLLLGHYAIRIQGLVEEESRRTIARLQNTITQPENSVRWRWRVGDVAIWDNRATQHRVIDDFGKQRRVMRRVTLTGPAPVAIDGRRSRTLRVEANAAAAE